MADSNRRQDKSHVGENQELNALIAFVSSLSGEGGGGLFSQLSKLE